MASSATEEFPPMQDIMLEFRAGKMILEGKRVVPDTRKGLVRIGKGEEGLVHFQWLDRTQNVVEDDQIIFPDEAVFEKVNQASGRVYILKFNTDDRKFFFWMQEPKAEEDPQLCISVNYYINGPLELLAEDAPEPSASFPVSDDMVEDDISSSLMSIQELVPNLNENDISVWQHEEENCIAAVFCRAGNLILPNLGADAISDVTSSSGPVKFEDLQRILSNIGGSSDHAEDPDAGLGLGDILKPDLIMPLIDTWPLDERLTTFLPEGQWTPEEISELLQSPPFRQQLDSFTYVLRMGQIDLSQFEIDPSKYKFTVLSFLEALEDSVSKISGSETLRQDPMDEGH